MGSLPGSENDSAKEANARPLQASSSTLSPSPGNKGRWNASIKWALDLHRSTLETRMSYAWRFLLRSLIAGLVAPGAFAARVTLNVEAPDGEVAEIAKVAPELSQYVDKDVSPAQIRRLFATADDQIREALEPLGYYGVRVESDLQRPDADGTWKATFRVIPGNPVIVEDVRIVVPGPAGPQPEVKTALDAFLPKKGDRLNHSAYEKSKTQIDTALRATTSRAHLARHRVAVTKSANTAEIDLEWEPSERHRFGAVELFGRPVSRDFPAALRAVERGRILHR